MDSLDDLFVPDGILRDVCLVDGDLTTWATLLSALRDSKWETTFYLLQDDSRTEAWNFLVAELFDGIAKNLLSIELAVRAGNLWLSGHMSTEDEIEFTFDPADIRTPNDQEEVLEFARWMSRTCKGRVVVTREAADHTTVPWLYAYIPPTA